MSERNVELARSLYQAFIKGDFAAAAHLVHPEIELQTPPGTPEEGIYKGYEAVRRHLAELMAPFYAVRLEPREFIDAGNEQVVVIVQVAGKGKSSGFEIETRLVHVLTLDDGRVTRRQAFLDTDEALQAAGLEAK
jgi:ketosteroid isomerase-like protein